MALPCGRAAEDGSRPRKPYVMSRRRETWSEREHQLFVEALSLYTRDWKQIQAHIGTKTAVQIRSHAQKYFQKQVKNGNGAAVPPPRAKRQPGTVPRGGRRRPAKSAAAATDAAEADSAAAAAARRTAAPSVAARRSTDGSSCAMPSDGDDASASCDGIQSPRRGAAGRGVRPARKTRRMTVSTTPSQASDDQASQQQGQDAAARLTALEQRNRNQMAAAQAPAPPTTDAAPDPDFRLQGFGCGREPPPLPPALQRWRGSFSGSSGNCSPQAAMMCPQPFFGGAPGGYPSWQQMCSASGLASGPHAAPPKDPPNYALVYNFLGSLFDGGCSEDHAAMLAGMGPNTRETATLCLRNLVGNMQAPAWQEQLMTPY